MKTITKENYKTIIHNAVLSDKSFNVLRKGRSKIITIDDFKYVTKRKLKSRDKDKNKILKKYAPSFFKNLQNQYNKYIIENDFKIDLVKENYKLVHRLKKDVWNNIENGKLFMKVDIEHAYWQILYNNGIINQKYYEDNLHPDFKLLRNMSIGYMIKKQSLDFYSPNYISEDEKKCLLETKDIRKIKPFVSTKCDVSIYDKIFKNVRQTSANTLGHIAFNILDGDFIKYVTDGIAFVPKSKEQVKCVYDYLKQNGFTFATNICRKISDRQINEKGVLKKI